MKIIKLITACFLLCICISAKTQSNENTIDILAAQLIKNIRATDKEQSFITTDKSIYTSGEELWFRAFLLHSVTQRISTTGKTLYAELVNQKDSIISRLILNAGMQQLSGRFKLPFTLQDGYYWVRAYTQNMVTNDKESFFQQPVYVKNPETKFIKPGIQFIYSDTPTVQFYPEGGNIITGASSRIILRITGKHQNALPVSGYIFDGKDTVAYFTTDEYGFASVEFEPSGYRKYNAFIKFNGNSYSYALPEINYYGAQIAVSTEDNGSKKIRVLLGDSIFNKQFSSYLLLVSKDSLWFASIGQGNYQLTVPTEKIPNGISTFYIYDKNNKLLSTRNIYTSHNSNISFNASTDKTLYAKRNKVLLNISVKDAFNNAIPSSLSISVTENHLLKNVDNKYLLDYYFANTNNVLNNWQINDLQQLTDAQKDIFMIAYTNKIYNTENNSLINTFNNNLFDISGTLLNKNNEPLPGTIIALLSKNTDGIMLDTTNEKGKFRFELSEYPDSTKFQLQVNSNDRKAPQSKIILDKQYFPETTNSYKPTFDITQEDVAKLKRFNIDTSISDPEGELKFVTVSTTIEPLYDKSKRISSFSRIITADELNNAGSGKIGSVVMIKGALQMVNGVLLAKGLTKMAAPDKGSEPLVIIDGQEANVGSFEDQVQGSSSPVLNFLNSLNPHNIDFIEVLSGPEAATFGVRGGNGAIVINTSSIDKLLPENVESNSKTFYARGYYNAPLFSQPDYSNKQKNISEIKDSRSSIYWDGSLLTDNNGNATAGFYTNDIPGTYIITIRGITVHGDIIYKTISYEVK